MRPLERGRQATVAERTSVASVGEVGVAVLAASNACFHNVRETDLESSEAMEFVRVLPDEPDLGQDNTFVCSVISSHSLFKAL